MTKVAFGGNYNPDMAKNLGLPSRVTYELKPMGPIDRFLFIHKKLTAEDMERRQPITLHA